MRQKVALFGGSFDPLHDGHKSIVEEALKLLEIDKLIVVPTFLNPFKSSTYFSTEERLFFCQKAFSIFEKVEVSAFEIENNRTTPSVETLNYFQQKYDVCFLIVGSDNLKNIDKWYNFNYLNTKIMWVIATRSGYEVDTSKLQRFKILEIDVDISSTEIRNTMIKDNSYMDMNDRVERIVTFLDSKKAEEIEVFDLEEIEYIAKRVVIANAISTKHAAALADQLKIELKPLGESFLHIDESEDWVVIDLGDILIHLMTRDARQLYSLEEFLSELTAGKFTSPHII